MNYKQTLIGFAGRKQSGKNTCAEFVASMYSAKNISNKIYSLADPLKQDICINLLGLTFEQCYGSDMDKNTLTDVQWDGKRLTAREVMQFVGTDLFRKMKHDVWINGMLNKIKNENLSLAICCDIRFVNEVERFKDIGGIVIKLTRNPHNSDHSSEIALDPNNYDQSNFDLVIDNHNMTIDEQCNVIKKFFYEKGLLPL
jgi:hypothetical protein